MPSNATQITPAQLPAKNIRASAQRMDVDPTSRSSSLPPASSLMSSLHQCNDPRGSVERSCIRNKECIESIIIEREASIPDITSSERDTVMS